MRLARALLAQCMAEGEGMGEVQPSDIVGDAVVGAQCVPLIEAQQVSRACFHQREIDVERRVAGGSHGRIQHAAHRLPFERVGAGQRARLCAQLRAGRAPTGHAASASA